MKKKVKIDESLSECNYVPSRKHPIRYKVGILMTKANISSINVFNALYVNMRQGRWATDLSL